MTTHDTQTQTETRDKTRLPRATAMSYPYSEMWFTRPDSLRNAVAEIVDKSLFNQRSALTPGQVGRVVTREHVVDSAVQIHSALNLTRSLVRLGTAVTELVVKRLKIADRIRTEVHRDNHRRLVCGLAHSLGSERATVKDRDRP